MSDVYIVDDDASGLASDLNDISARDRHGVSFTAMSTPEKLFDQMRRAVPDLVLVHHHWPGVTIAELLQRIHAVSGNVRVIVFTGRSIAVKELIECVRFGAADYWTQRGSLDAEMVFRRIAHYCSSSVWCMAQLKMASGSQTQLLTQLEAATRRIETLESANRELTAKVRDLQSEETTTIKKWLLAIARLIFVAVVCVASFYVAKVVIKASEWQAFALVIVIATTCLLMDGKLQELVIKWRGGSASVKGATK